MAEFVKIYRPVPIWVDGISKGKATHMAWESPEYVFMTDDGSMIYSHPTLMNWNKIEWELEITSET